MNPALIVLLMFLAVIILFILRTPVAFTLGAVGIVSLYLINGPRFLQMLPPSIIENMTKMGISFPAPDFCPDTEKFSILFFDNILWDEGLGKTWPAGT